MKIKVFTTTQKGMITLTQKELQELLNEAYYEGYKDGSEVVTYKSSPLVTTTPWVTTTVASEGNKTIPYTSNTGLTLSAEDLKPYSISYSTGTDSVCATIGGKETNEI